MKTVFCLFLFVATTGAYADSFLQLGHWPAEKINETRPGHFRVNEAEFTISDWKLAPFLRCVHRAHPKKEVFIEGINDSVSGNFVATAAYICDGEINLGSCAPANNVWFCN